MGFPGTMPYLNASVVQKAITAGLALDASINLQSHFDRKHYFYPDLPKGYQITQYEVPYCENGSVAVNGRRIDITRIHIEEDAAKTLQEGIDYNRAGVPLIEIVTAAQLYSGDEAAKCFEKIHSILVCAGVTTGRMNEGAMRCDVNLSLHQSGMSLGTRTEIKNLNSFQAVKRAVAAERKRQMIILESGNRVKQQTCRYDEKSNRTIPVRDKETATDYRFMRECDIPDLVLTQKDIQSIRIQLPPLPDAKKASLQEHFDLSDEQCDVLLCRNWALSLFQNASTFCNHHQTLYHLITGVLFRIEADDVTINPQDLALIATWIVQDKLSTSKGRELLTLVIQSGEAPQQLANDYSLWQINDDRRLRDSVTKAITQNEKMVSDYLNGKMKVFPALVGAAMKQLSGCGNAQKIKCFMQEELYKLSIK